MIKRFEIVTCCGTHCEYVEMDVPSYAEACNYYFEVLEYAGYHNYQCESCYDSAYQVRDA